MIHQGLLNGRDELINHVGQPADSLEAFGLRFSQGRGVLASTVANGNMCGSRYYPSVWLTGHSKNLTPATYRYCYRLPIAHEISLDQFGYVLISFGSIDEPG